MEDFIKVIVGIIAVAIIAIFLLIHFGILGFGKGNGNGTGQSEHISNEDESVSEAITEEPEEIVITIVVKQDQYFIDEQEVTLTQIKKSVTDDSAEVKVIIEDNYASAKAWDEIKDNLNEWGIIPVEQ